MKRAIFVCLLTITVTSAMAEWTLVTKTDTGTGYIDNSLINKSGDFRKFWLVINLKPESKKRIRSLRMRQEIDCKEQRFRILLLSEHTQTMAGGDMLASGPSADQSWNDIEPQTPGHDLLKIVCTMP